MEFAIFFKFSVADMESKGSFGLSLLQGYSDSDEDFNNENDEDITSKSNNIAHHMVNHLDLLHKYILIEMLQCFSCRLGMIKMLKNLIRLYARVMRKWMQNLSMKTMICCHLSQMFSPKISVEKSKVINLANLQ